ncbi:MAG: carboxymuconolactone decarboxylase family protein [Haloferacaceae archaeon]
MARLPHVSASELDPEHERLLYSPLQDGKPLNLYAVLGNNPALLAGMRSYFGAMWGESGLTDRQRELLILAVAEEVDSAYELHQHYNIAPEVGVTAEELEAIVAGNPEPFAESEVLLVAYGRAVARGDVTDHLHERMVDTFGAETVVGAATIGGAYLGLARVVDALGIEPEAE